MPQTLVKLLQGILRYCIAAAQLFKTFSFKIAGNICCLVGIYILPNTYPIFHFANR